MWYSITGLALIWLPVQLRSSMNERLTVTLVRCDGFGLAIQKASHVWTINLTLTPVKYDDFDLATSIAKASINQILILVLIEMMTLILLAVQPNHPWMISLTLIPVRCDNFLPPL